MWCPGTYTTREGVERVQVHRRFPDAVPCMCVCAVLVPGSAAHALPHGMAKLHIGLVAPCAAAGAGTCPKRNEHPALVDDVRSAGPGRKVTGRADGHARELAPGVIRGAVRDRRDVEGRGSSSAQRHEAVGHVHVAMRVARRRCGARAPRATLISGGVRQRGVAQVDRRYVAHPPLAMRRRHGGQGGGSSGGRKWAKFRLA